MSHRDEDGVENYTQEKRVMIDYVKSRREQHACDWPLGRGHSDCDGKHINLIGTPARLFRQEKPRWITLQGVR